MTTQAEAVEALNGAIREQENIKTEAELHLSTLLTEAEAWQSRLEAADALIPAMKMALSALNAQALQNARLLDQYNTVIGDAAEDPYDAAFGTTKEPEKAPAQTFDQPGRAPYPDNPVSPDDEDNLPSFVAPEERSF